MLDCLACKEKRNKLTYFILHIFTCFIRFINCPAFVNINQTYKLALEISVIN